MELLNNGRMQDFKWFTQAEHQQCGGTRGGERKNFQTLVKPRREKGREWERAVREICLLLGINFSFCISRLKSVFWVFFSLAYVQSRKKLKMDFKAPQSSEAGCRSIFAGKGSPDLPSVWPLAVETFPTLWQYRLPKGTAVMRRLWSFANCLQGCVARGPMQSLLVDTNFQGARPCWPHVHCAALWTKLLSCVYWDLQNLWHPPPQVEHSPAVIHCGLAVTHYSFSPIQSQVGSKNRWYVKVPCEAPYMDGGLYFITSTLCI